MWRSTPFKSRISSLVFALGFFLAIACVICASQSVDKTANGDDERTEAFELYKQGKFVDAMPLFERLAADHPSDPATKEAWAWCILQYSGTLSDPGERKKARVRARMIAVEAKNLGDTSQLVQVLLDLPEAGFEATFSDRKEVNEAMKAAEADFSRGDLDKAREGYLRALALDPMNYDAALFIGDVYFKQHIYASAGEWFLRAIQSDANRETAYRYWGDALAATGKENDARGKFI
ncbi:MAG TPA: tetratricopeptide repeat protein, partial [Terriglobales bacterium]|nr:tetratricopeptide repeat protein [Terriglobales bacterium]